MVTTRNPKLVAVLPGDGVGPEVVGAALTVLRGVTERFGLDLEFKTGLVGGAAIRAMGETFPPATAELCDGAQAILFGAVGDAAFESLPREQRPETALSILRRRYELYANLRPVTVHPELGAIVPLKDHLTHGVDMLIVRELTGDAYYGRPRGIGTTAEGVRCGVNTMIYTEAEVRRIAHEAFRLARTRRRHVTSVDKANALEVFEFWRTIVCDVAAEYPDVTLEHLYVDNAAMQLIRRPSSFDVVLTGNIFGDILSDEAAMLAGSIGLIPSASIGPGGMGLYEPIHGTAPDIAGQDRANPIGTILSGAMMLRLSFVAPAAADAIEAGVRSVIGRGLRTADIALPGEPVVGTAAMGEAVLKATREGGW